MDEISTYLHDVMEWTEYEAIAYQTLVKEGALEASQLVTRSSISKGKEYEVLNKLVSRDVVVTQGTHPERYKAVEPRQLIEEKQDEISDKIDQLKHRLGTAYEMQQESAVARRGNSVWMSRGRAGLARKAREYIEKSEESVHMKLWDPRWLESKDLRDLNNLQARDVDVKIVCFDGRTEVDNIASAGIPTWESSSVDTTYCVFDGETVAMEVQDGNMGIGYQDPPLARVFAKDFQQSLDSAQKVTTDG
ncbi:hypothetical protein C482_02446 [Natrialba chahannaoensis JCM 10990]|uniref:Transcription regulator TrmB N-terminal domain-containing protein n=1 Tax=Natrialba chahannaoensis JCM 10990 TaxID=1227492 RepID=M0B528_9EURY|nr:helix-turn-helix domain-containing protein [Natrialba chahannaoensis]ELZ05373.1 hypothetical protein C482_02446 [Natrialba chahannaoensis JCM 10990]